MKPNYKIKHPKLILLAVIIVSAYFIFSNEAIENYLSSLGSLSYMGVFLGGILFAFGFTVPFAVGIFLTIQPEYILLAGIIGGMGSVIGDIVILNVIRKAFIKDFRELKKTRVIKKIEKTIASVTNKSVRHYLLYLTASLIIVLPVPDEIGISLLAGFTKIDQKIFSLVSFVLHTAGILILLLI